MRASAQCWMAIALLALVTPCPALASDDSNQAAMPQASLLPDVPAYLRQITDWGGLRSKLEQDGLKFTFTYYGDAFANPSGGVQQGFGYDGRFGTIIDADLDKLWGWSGATFHASIHQIHGTQFSATNLDNPIWLPVSTNTLTGSAYASPRDPSRRRAFSAVRTAMRAAK